MIIILSGKQGSGKTTLAMALRKHLGEEASVRARFAQPLYEMHDACRKIMSSYGINIDFNKKDGYLLQLLGTEWARNKLHTDVLVQCVTNRAVQLQQEDPDKVIIVEDCRFENEYDMLKSQFQCITVRLECNRMSRKQRAEMWRETEDHPSETGLDHYASTNKFDLLIHTDVMAHADVLSKVVTKIEERL